MTALVESRVVRALSAAIRFTASTFCASWVKRSPDSSSFPCSMSIRPFSSESRVSELAREAWTCSRVADISCSRAAIFLCCCACRLRRLSRELLVER